MGNASYSTCGAALARPPHGDDPRAEVVGHGCVFLNVYDLNQDWLHANNLFHDVLRIGGAFHAGVEVYGREWSFGQEGVSSTPPRAHEVHIYRKSIPMGRTDMSPAEVSQLVECDVVPRWQRGDYDLLRRNCCSFADFLCGRLVRRRIPGVVDRFPKVASAASRGLGKVMDFGGSVSTGAPSEPRHGGRSFSAMSNESQASMTTAASPASTSPSSSEPGTPRTPPSRGWSMEPETSREEDSRHFSLA